MINKQLIDFVKQALARDETKEKITNDLVTNGWALSDIEECFNIIASPISKSKKKKIKIAIFVLLGICFFVWINFSLHTPILETCIESGVIASDQSNGNLLKQVECLKGFTISKLPDGGSDLYSQTTSGYIVSPKNKDTISSTLFKKYGNSNLGFNKEVDVSFYDASMFTIKKTVISNGQETPRSELYHFSNNTIEKIADVPFGHINILAYKNNEVFYYKISDDYNPRNYNTDIYKYNLLTGENTSIIDLSYLKRDEFYSHLYGLCSYEENDRPIFSFKIVASVDKKTSKQIEEYYSLDLYSGELKKVDYNSYYSPKHSCRVPGYGDAPGDIKYSVVSGLKAKDYGLDYDITQATFTYNFLLLFKKGVHKSL